MIGWQRKDKKKPTKNEDRDLVTEGKPKRCQETSVAIDSDICHGKINDTKLISMKTNIYNITVENHHSDRAKNHFQSVVDMQIQKYMAQGK